MKNFRKETKIVKIKFTSKITRSYDDDSRKDPLKYFCLKFHIYLTRNKYHNFAFGIYRSVSLLFIFVWALMQGKICNRLFFSLFSRDPDSRSISNFCKFMYMVCKFMYICWIT